VKDFAKTLGNLGVRRDHTVLLYDHSGGIMASARMWWMLRSIGHTEVYVVDGGFDALVAAEAPVSVGHSDAIETEVYVADVVEWNWPQVRMEEVASAVADGASLIDVRSAERYAGLQEPIDLIAGHIPGAINIPLSENLEAGTFKSVAVLRQLYAPVVKDQTILQCGSGVTACHTLLAMVHAGFDVPTLYNGSWSQWSRNENPMVLAPTK
jgi:thiosulfate/3-mercaptopyruvate sulfurtransferase